ncbi:magnesium/cobalt transporter CorA [Persicobacter diffluens]|uniref:Magnesium transport protein CorA n=1 Tax=Persicobacter diffluens TaxID=981 RepID=A0AAN4W487_9BACT|nr:magnesium transport protein CorA [Persicobacter diffluens]
MIPKILNRKKVNPSTPIFTGKKILEKTSIQLFKYNDKELIEYKDFDLRDFSGFPEDDHYYWLNIHGIHEVDKIKQIGNALHIHELYIQDILDVYQRPKVQDYNDFWFFNLKSTLPSKDWSLEQEQLSFVLNKNVLISFQERQGDHFQHIRERLHKHLGIVRERGVDYLLFLLMEAIMDNYFQEVARMDAELDQIGRLDISKDPSPDIINTIEKFRNKIHLIRKNISPFRDFVARLEREKFKSILDKNIKYYYEIQDNYLSLSDNCERMEMKLESISNLFFSIQGHRMNQVMKTLTIVATIFIPLTFIAGIYGMNFSYMPELNLKWGYFGILGLMFFMTVGMLYYFIRKKYF